MPSSHADFSAWTAGAQRVWEAAHDLAAARRATVVAVEHLLWGLLSDENRAADQLQKAGVSADTFQRVWGKVGEGLEAGRQGLEPLSRHELLEEVLIEARTEAFRAGTGVELGTEHLLIGLCRVPSDVSTWLAEFGIGIPVRAGTAQQILTAADQTMELVTAPELSRPWTDPMERDFIDTYRILDAAANRTREGLRVVEDFVRWAWNEGFLSQQLKECRHELADILGRLPQPILIASRDTMQDVGTEIRTASEYRRESPAAVATASLKRVEEALRSLEEFSKVIDADVSSRLEQLRYRIYTLEKSIQTTIHSRWRLNDQRMCLLATNSLCHHGLGPAILGALQAGVRMIQLREKSLPDRELLDMALRVRHWTKDFEAIFIVNDRPDIAVLANADGVHVGQDDFSVSAARRILGPDKLVGVSTHSIEQARQAVRDGADYLGVGPVFPSSTKAFAEFPGLEFVLQAAAEIAAPWFAIGGITPEHVSELKAAGADRIAVSSAICSAEEPGWAAGELLARWNS